MFNPNKMSEEILDDGPIAKKVMKYREFDFPLKLEFKIGTLSNDFTAKDAQGQTLAYVRQKLFRFKEKVDVYSDDSKKDLRYRIKADRVIDFNACYAFSNEDLEEFGKIGRKGMKSLWKASYTVFDHDGKEEFHVKEENPWAKVMDAVLGEIPVINFFTGYLANPKYIIKRPDGTDVVRLKKDPSFWGRKFTIDKLSELEEGEDERLLLGLMMLSLLERRRG